MMIAVISVMLMACGIERNGRVVNCQQVLNEEP
jgi:hypothetical protein